MIKQIIDRIRLLVKPRKEPYWLLYSVLGFVPNDIKYYELALRHKSSRYVPPKNKAKKGQYVNNERLEFLGDALLSAVVADILYKHFDTKPEGFLTNVRSRIVQRESLNRIAQGLGLDKLLNAEQGQSHTKHNIFGNAFEAIIGAIYLDKGYPACYNFVEKQVIKRLIDIEKVAYAENNFKSKLLEWGQKNRKEIIFELIEETIGEKNSPTFRTRILIQGEEISQGSGNSKKKSQQLAAKTALKKIRMQAY